MSVINDINLEIFKYIKFEENKLHSLERTQDGNSNIAHDLETLANTSYDNRTNYINAVQDMRKYRAGVVAHHEYISDLQIRYMEITNKIMEENAK